MPWLNGLKNALQWLREPEEQQPERWPATGLTALYGVDCASTPAAVKGINASGIYLLTAERLLPGRQVTLILRKQGDPEQEAELQFSVPAQVASVGADGFELSFVLPPGMDLDLWAVLVRNIVTLTDSDQVAEVIRTLRTMLFLCRICGSEAEQPILLFNGQLDSDRTATLFKIAFAVENQLASEPDGARMRAYPTLAATILREGSWAPDELILKLWTGLLASSCSLQAPDDSNQIFVDLLVHFTPTEGRILDHACERALATASGPENTAPASVVLTPQQMTDLTGVHDLTRNAASLAYLFNLGLMEKVFDFTSYHDIESFDITPSALGLTLYRHCHGHRETIDPHLVEIAKEHLAVFFPPPHPSVFENFTPLSPDPSEN